MHKRQPRQLGLLAPCVSLLLATACAPVDEDGQGDDFAAYDDESEGGLDDKAISGPTKIKNEGTGRCLRRSTTQKIGNGYEVYQSSCDDSSADLLWRQDCNGNLCKYTSGDAAYCLKASSSVKASGGSYKVYAASCSSDSDQQWTVSDLGSGRRQLKSKETGRCAYTSGGETTADGKPAVVQRDCATTEKFLFTMPGSGGNPGGGTSGGGTTGGGSGGGNSGGSGGGIEHLGTTQVWDSNGQDVRLARPAKSAPGDLLVLFLHRTDDVLPLQVSGWKRVAECYKENNGFQCSTEDDCTTRYDSSFCKYFGGSKTGRDLAQSVFVRTVGSGEPSSYSFNFNMDSSGHPGWAILTALRGANTTDPVRDWAHVGCDGSLDSVFPSVRGEAGDMLLMSQSFDDAISQSKFGPPSGASAYGYVSNSDEAGFLFGRSLRSSGETGKMTTNGDGASDCKDALISLTIKPR